MTERRYCEHCAVPIVKENKRFCSLRCWYDSPTHNSRSNHPHKGKPKSEETKRRLSLACGKKGREHPAFKGYSFDGNGYKKIFFPEHPRAINGRYVYEHRLVMEKRLNRYLKKGEVVHHIDSDKKNNNPINLHLFSNESEHQKYHCFLTERVLVNFLRSQLSDVNTSRSGQWIFPDFPRVTDLGNASFPRIGVTTLSESGDPLGMYCDDVYDSVTFQIDVVAKKGQVYDVTTSGEALGTIRSTVNSNRLTFTSYPNSVGSVAHNGTDYANVVQVTTIGSFTTPSSVGAGTVQYAFSTGDLNFDSTDVTNHDGESITATSTTSLEGKKLCQYLARKIIVAVKNNWRSERTINGLFYPIKVSNISIPFDEELGIFRQTIEFQFKIFNAGEGI